MVKLSSVALWAGPRAPPQALFGVHAWRRGLLLGPEFSPERVAGLLERWWAGRTGCCEPEHSDLLWPCGVARRSESTCRWRPAPRRARQRCAGSPNVCWSKRRGPPLCEGNFEACCIPPPSCYGAAWAALRMWRRALSPKCGAPRAVRDGVWARRMGARAQRCRFRDSSGLGATFGPAPRATSRRTLWRRSRANARPRCC